MTTRPLVLAALSAAFTAAVVILVGALASPALAGSLVAARAIAVKSVITAADLRPAEGELPGAVRDPANAVGREARVTIFEGRPIRPGDLAAPTLVERNDIVRLRFTIGALEIGANGRALDRGAEGDRISVMNLGSRTIIAGVVEGPGLVEVAR